MANPQICTRLCCEDPSCDLAYMFGRTCFLVKCYSERSCRTIPDEDARRNVTNFDRSTQYIIKRKFGVRLRDGKGKGNIDGTFYSCVAQIRIVLVKKCPLTLTLTLMDNWRDTTYLNYSYSNSFMILLFIILNYSTYQAMYDTNC